MNSILMRMDKIINWIFLIMAYITFITSGAFGVPKPDNNVNEIANVNCGELGDCPSSPMNCHNICGCDRFAAFHYNETTGECVLSFKHLMVAIVTKYEQIDNDLAHEHSMKKAIRLEAETIFNAILVSVVIFITCSSICVVSACFYCCRINYTDYRLKADIKALAKKLKRNETVKKSKKLPLPMPVAESCNIVCEDAGVFVV